MVKTLKVRDGVYRRLAAVKRRDESFSELFKRLMDDSSSLELLAKLRGRAEFTDKQKMLAEIRATRAERRI